MASAPLLLICLLALASAAAAANFTCTSRSATCSSLINFLPPNATTLAALSALFQVPSLPLLLGANNKSLSTPANTPVPANFPIRIPIPCSCSSFDQTGRSDRVPLYKVKPDEFLDLIARTYFAGFVTYQEIAAANNISNPSNILIGQELWIPLPCSCDPVDGSDVVHLGYRVASGDTLAGIAQQFRTDESTVSKLNGITDPKSLKEEQILDIPLPACRSSISSTSNDKGLRLPHGSYAFAAKGCLICSCSSGPNFYGLDCDSANSTGLDCFVPTCQGLHLGSIAGSGCDAKTCAYAGYTNRSSTDVTIQTTLVSNSSSDQCKHENGAPGSSASARSRPWRRDGLLRIIGLIAWLYFH